MYRPKQKRAFTGLAGSMFSHTADPIVQTPTAKSGVVDELVAKQRVEQDALKEMWEFIQYEGWQPGDDDPIVRPVRARNDGGVPRFQKYAFQLGAQKSKRRDFGTDPRVYGSMSADRAVRQSGLDDQGGSFAAGIYSNAKEPDSTSASIAKVAQSMTKGFSTGVLSSSFDFTNPPRAPKPETAWIFNDQRFKFFICRQIPDEAIEAYEKAGPQGPNAPNDPLIVGKFRRALKTFVALYQYFKIGLSDAGFFGDVSLEHQSRMWPSRNAIARDRERMIQEGLALFGTSKEPKEPKDYDPDRVNCIWPIFMRVFRSLEYFE